MSQAGRRYSLKRCGHIGLISTSGLEVFPGDEPMAREYFFALSHDTGSSFADLD